MGQDRMWIYCSKDNNKKKYNAFKKVAASYAFDITDTVLSVNKQDWDSIQLYGSEFLDTSYLKIIEDTHTSTMRFYYSIFYKSGKSVAIAYFQVLDFNSDNFQLFLTIENKETACKISSCIKSYLSKQVKRSIEKPCMRLLICGNTFISGEHGFACIPGEDKQGLMNELVNVIDCISKKEKLRGKIAGVLLKDFYVSANMEFDKLKKYRYYDFFVEPSMQLPINWSTFDSYLQAMSKKYRNRAKNIIKKGENLIRKNFSAKDISDYENEISVLYQNVFAKSKFKLASVSSNYFEEIKEQMKDDFIFTAYFFEKKLIGFKTLFILNKRVEAHLIGLNYDYNKRVDLYQNILYDYVRDSIDYKVAELFLGRTAAEIKSTIGAKPVELKCYMRHQNPLSNQIIKPFIDYLKPAEWIPRNPFKEIEVEVDAI